MSEELDIRKGITYIAQDKIGYVHGHVRKPEPGKFESFYSRTLKLKHPLLGRCLAIGKCNPDWKNTVIELGVDRYSYQNGILEKLP